MTVTSDLSPFFSPKGVAIIGASSKPNKLSYGILENLTQYHYEGAVYPINPNADVILGHPCYANVRDVPDPVDLAVIVLPAGMTLEALQDCAARGIKAVVIISGGFREIGEEGQNLENACMAIAKANQMRIIGPNCVGTMDMYSGLNTTFIKGMPDAGPIGFVSQSGAVCGGVVDLIIDKHVGFSHFASLGNEMDVSETDMIAYFGQDPHVKVIAVYVEGIKDGQRFMEVAKEVSKQKPIVMLKAGRSDAGAKAVSSHTGSLAGSYTAYQAAFKQCGVIEVETVRELFNVAWALGSQELPSGKRAVIVTNSGGPAALASDSLAANGFSLAEVSAESQQALRVILNPSAQVSNPIDMLGGAEPHEYNGSLQILREDEGVDVLLTILVPQSLVDPKGVAQAWVDNSQLTSKTMLSCIMGDVSVEAARVVLHKAGVPMYQYPDEVGQVLGAMQYYKDFLEKKDLKGIKLEGINQAEAAGLLKTLDTNQKALGEHQTRPLLEAYGIPVIPGGFAKNDEDAVNIADRIGYPVALKIVSEDILHKSDMGGIKLGIDSANKLRIVYQEMFEHLSKATPKARLDGVLVEKMAGKGQEVIIGMRRDPTFGPLIMFGMGGIFVELIKDVTFGVAPLSLSDIKGMVDSTYAGKLLKGYRGSQPADVDAVVDIIARLSQLALDHPEIDELEINPLLVFEQGQGAISLDSRAIIK